MRWWPRPAYRSRAMNGMTSVGVNAATAIPIGHCRHSVSSSATRRMANAGHMARM